MGLFKFLHKTDIVGDRNQADDDADFHSIFEIEDLDSLDISDSSHLNGAKKPIPSSGETKKIHQEISEIENPQGLKKNNTSLIESDQSMMIKQKTAIVWNNKGVVLTRLGKYTQAIDAYNQAISINPNYSNAWNNKGVVLSRLGKYSEAINAYNHALIADPDYQALY